MSVTEPSEVVNAGMAIQNEGRQSDLWSFGHSVGRSIGWLGSVGRSVGWLVGLSVGWLVGWLVCRSVGWFVGWLVGWLVA